MSEEDETKKRQRPKGIKETATYANPVMNPHRAGNTPVTLNLSEWQARRLHDALEAAEAQYLAEVQRLTQQQKLRPSEGAMSLVSFNEIRDAVRQQMPKSVIKEWDEDGGIRGG